MKYHELLEQRQALDAQIADALRAESGEAISTVRKLISDYALTETDCGFSPQWIDEVPKIEKTRKPATVKYVGQKGETWSGRGRAPKWLRDIESAGGSREHYSITKDAA